MNKSKFANKNLNAVMKAPAPSSRSRDGASETRGGRSTFSKTFHSRSSSSGGGGNTSVGNTTTTAAPAPINTPSLRKENRGQDITVSLVPSGGSGWGGAGGIKREDSPSLVHQEPPPAHSMNPPNDSTLWAAPSSTSSAFFSSAFEKPKPAESRSSGLFGLGSGKLWGDEEVEDDERRLLETIHVHQDPLLNAENIDLSNLNLNRIEHMNRPSGVMNSRNDDDDASHSNHPDRQYSQMMHPQQHSSSSSSSQQRWRKHEESRQPPLPVEPSSASLSWRSSMTSPFGPPDDDPRHHHRRPAYHSHPYNNSSHHQHPKQEHRWGHYYPHSSSNVSGENTLVNGSTPTMLQSRPGPKMLFDHKTGEMVVAPNKPIVQPNPKKKDHKNLHSAASSGPSPSSTRLKNKAPSTTKGQDPESIESPVRVLHREKLSKKKANDFSSTSEKKMNAKTNSRRPRENSKHERNDRESKKNFVPQKEASNHATTLQQGESIELESCHERENKKTMKKNKPKSKRLKKDIAKEEVSSLEMTTREEEKKEWTKKKSGAHQENDAEPLPKHSTITGTKKNAQQKYVKKQKSDLNDVVEKKDKKPKKGHRPDKKEAAQSTGSSVDEDPRKKGSSTSESESAPVLNTSATKDTMKWMVNTDCTVISSKSGHHESRNMTRTSTKKKGKNTDTSTSNSTQKAKPRDSKKTNHGIVGKSNGDQVYVRKEKK